MPTGIDTISSRTTDVVGNQSNAYTATVKVDHTAPVSTLSGSLWDARGQTLSPGNYTLNVNATDGANDGNPADAQSGVVSITTYVDGTQVPGMMTYGGSVSGPNTQTCPTDSCTMAETMQFPTVAFLPGPHTIQITTTDQLGHQTQQQFNVTTSDVPAPTVG
jgi:hypothetical protein